MEERKNFLARLRDHFGDCNRQSFLQKLRDFFGNSARTADNGNESRKTESNLPAPTLKILDINGTDAWRNHVEKLKNVSVLRDYISNFPESGDITSFIRAVNNILNDITNYVDKHFKETEEINEDTNENVAQKTGKLVKDHVWDLLRGCHIGIKHNQGMERKFYESFYDALEQYLSSIGVCRKNITEGMDIRLNAKWFETPFIRESSVKGRVGQIDEIEVFPHFIPYRDDDGRQDELILKGVCIAFGEMKKGDK